VRTYKENHCFYSHGVILNRMRYRGKKLEGVRSEKVQLTRLVASLQWCRLLDALVRLRRLNHRSAPEDKNKAWDDATKLQKEFNHSHLHKRSWHKIWLPGREVVS